MARMDWSNPGCVAAITGAASGIGLAAARAFRARGLSIALIDRDAARLTDAEAALASAGGEGETAAFVCDVADMDALAAVRNRVFDRFGRVDVLMNNAGVEYETGAPWERLADWKALFDVNFWGVVHGCQAFLPAMLEAGRPGAVVNTGSKQGITKPPGNGAYNMSKAALLTYTEGLSHALREREAAITAHVLIPGFTFTPLAARGRTEKPAGAWTPEQVAQFMMTALDAGDFYILCPDNDVTREVDRKRILWAAGDLTENRSALSRWDDDYAEAFDAFMARPLPQDIF